MQPGDVPDIYADVSDLVRDFVYPPNTTLTDGVSEFVLALVAPRASGCGVSEEIKIKTLTARRLRKDAA